MKIVNMKITADISLDTTVTPFIEDKAFEAISAYQFDDKDNLVSEHGLATESAEICHLLSDGIIHEHDIDNAAIRPKKISAIMGELKATLISAFNNNNCRGGSLRIETDSYVKTAYLNNQQDCYAALKLLKVLVPTTTVEVNLPAAPQTTAVDVSLPPAAQNNTWMTNAYTMVKENRVPFLLVAVASCTAVALRNNMS